MTRLPAAASEGAISAVSPPEAIASPAPPTATNPRRHPAGLKVLAMTETWERFSFYGMQALLMLYMVQALLPNRPGERVAGFGAFRALLESLFGALPDAALASQITGLYAGLVYLTPILGGYLGDRWLGGRRMVLIGAGLMACGHFLLAFDTTFLVAMALLILGSGCLKGNIAAQVGRLYAPDDARRDRAYLWFNFGINSGAFAGPLVCGGIGDKLGWHWGFAAAGIGMLIGMLIYASNLRHLPADRGRAFHRSAARAAPLSRDERRRIAAVLAVILLLLAYNLPFGQAYVIFPLWISQAADLRVSGGFSLPIPWYLASDGLVTAASTPLVLALWRRQAARGREPGEIGKIAIGCAMMACGDLLFALLAATTPAHQLHWAWGFAYFGIVSTSYLFTMPILLALVSRATPPRLVGTMMGLAYAGLFVANVGGGWIGRFYAILGPAGFWVLQAALAGTGLLGALIIRRPIGAILRIPGDR
jgi:POT family proton-dependent oligopeptide transporter